MHVLALIGSLDGNSLSAAETPPTMAMAADALRTPGSFWLVILIGIVISPWMVRRPVSPAIGQAPALYAASAILFLAGVLLFLGRRERFISVFVDLGSLLWLLKFPLILGASPIGAAFLVLAWYYVHPVSWIITGARAGWVTMLRAFAPMLLAMTILGFMMTVSIVITLL